MGNEKVLRKIEREKFILTIRKRRLKFHNEERGFSEFNIRMQKKQRVIYLMILYKWIAGQGKRRMVKFKKEH